MKNILLILFLVGCGPNADKKQLETVLGIKKNAPIVQVKPEPIVVRESASIPPLVEPVKKEPVDDDNCGAIVPGWETNDNEELVDVKVSAKELRDEVLRLKSQLKDSMDREDYFKEANKEYFENVQSLQADNKRLKDEVQAMLVKASGR